MFNFDFSQQLKQYIVDPIPDWALELFSVLHFTILFAVAKF